MNKYMLLLVTAFIAFKHYSFINIRCIALSETNLLQTGVTSTTFFVKFLIRLGILVEMNYTSLWL